MTARALSGAVAAQDGQQGYSPLELAKRAVGRPLSPCGTIAAYRRHVRAGEPVDAACETANVQENARKSQERVRQQQAKDAREAAAKVAATAPVVTLDGGTVTIVASLEDARALAAAVLDRAMSLEKVAGATAQAVDQRAKGAMLRAVHKAIVQQARAAA